MNVKKTVAILQDSPLFGEFLERNPDYDTITRTLSAPDLVRIQEEYLELNLFPIPIDEVIAITLVSRVIMQNGYPKLKAYIDIKKEEIMHVFVSK